MAAPTPEQAERIFQKTLRLSASGKSSAYMQRLVFDVPVEPERSYPLP